MADSPLQIAQTWETLLEQGKILLDQEQFAKAENILQQALVLARQLGDDDTRIAATMERLAFAHQRQGRNAEAEALYKEALERSRMRFLMHETKRSCVDNLVIILEQSGRDAEAKALREKNPQSTKKISGINPGAFQRMAKSPELACLFSLSATAGSSVSRAMEQLAAQVETIYGAHSLFAADAQARLGTRYVQENRHSARAHHERALLIRKTDLGENNAEVADSLRSLAMCCDDQVITNALDAKARSIEQSLGIVSPAHNAIATLHAMVGSKPPPDQPAEDVDKTLKQFYATLSLPEAKPPLPLELAERHQFLLDLLLSTLPEVRASEHGAKHPLSTINTLSMISKYYAKLENLEQSRVFKEEEMALIAEHWGEGHRLMVDAVKEYTNLGGTYQ